MWLFQPFSTRTSPALKSAGVTRVLTSKFDSRCASITLTCDFACPISCSFGHNVDIFPIVLADRFGLFYLLRSWWAEYEHLYLLFIPETLFMLYYSCLLSDDSSNNISEEETLNIFYIATPAALHSLLYPAEEAPPDYNVGSFRIEHAAGSYVTSGAGRFSQYPESSFVLRDVQEDAYGSGTCSI